MKGKVFVTWLLTLLAFKASAQTHIKAKEAYLYIGKKVTVQDSVRSHEDFDDNTFLYLGAAFPRQSLTIVYKGRASSFFKDVDQKLITVIGVVVKQKEGLEIIVDDPDMLTVRKMSILN